MDINTILTSKTKPNLSNYEKKELVDLLFQKNINVDESLTTNQLIDLFLDLWNKHTYNDSDCPICLEKVTNLNHLVTLCGHYFHTMCYTKYVVGVIKNNSELKCPQCRTCLLPKESESNNNIFSSQNTSIYNDLSHQEMFYPPTGFLSRHNFYENNDVDFDIASDNFSFPINLYSGMWTDVNQISGILVHNIIGNPYQSDIDNNNSCSSSESESESESKSNS